MEQELNTNVCVEVCRAIFPGMKWFVLENGTLLYRRDVPEIDDTYVIDSMGKLAKRLGPYSGEGSVYGDCIPRKLLKFTGWLVAYSLEGMVTYVAPEEMENVPQDAYSSTEMMSIGGSKFVRASEPPIEMLDMRVALFGRYKRNLDARSPKIIRRSTDK